MKKEMLLCLSVMALFAAGCSAEDKGAEKAPLKELIAPKYESTAEQAAKGEKKMIAKKGDKVKVQYEGSTTADGKVFDKSRPDSPLEFTVGAGQMIKGFDKAVEGMKLNEEKTASFSCEEGYGKRDEKMIMKFKKDFFNGKLPVKGDELTLQDQSGYPHKAVVVDVSKDEASLDLNHFLAGKDLTFKIKLVSIE